MIKYTQKLNQNPEPEPDKEPAQTRTETGNSLRRQGLAAPLPAGNKALNEGERCPCAKPEFSVACRFTAWGRRQKPCWRKRPSGRRRLAGAANRINNAWYLKNIKGKGKL